MDLTVADVIIQQLINWGVKRIYGVAGDTILYFFNRLADYPEIQLITTRHESTAAFMASAEAKLTGQLTVCIGHSGPGTANLINGLGDAYVDRCPVLALTGQVERWHMGTDYKQYIKQERLLNGITDFSEVLTHPESTTDLLTKAMRKSITSGTVTHLVIPKDVFSLPTNNVPRDKEPYLNASPHISPETIKDTALIIDKSQKPILLVGRGAIMAQKEVLNLAEKIGAAIITTLPGKGIVSYQHHLNLGGIGHAGSESARKALEESDLVIIIGATWWPYKYVPHNIPIIQIDINPANLGSTKIITYGLVGKLEQLLPLLINDCHEKNNSSWIERVKALKNEWDQRLEDETRNSNSPIKPQTIIKELEKVIPADAVISLDVGDHVVWFSRSFKNQNQQILVSGKWRSMGFGLPAAIAAGLVYPEKTIVLITGDGGLSMVMGDLVTAVRYQIPVKIFVFNNNSLAMEMNRMLVENLKPNGVDLTNPDFTLIAKASGLNAYAVNTPEDLASTIKNTFKEKGPVLVDIKTATTIPPHTTL